MIPKTIILLCGMLFLAYAYTAEADVQSQQPAQHWAVTPLEGQFTVAPAARHDVVVVAGGA